MTLIKLIILGKKYVPICIYFVAFVLLVTKYTMDVCIQEERILHGKGEFLESHVSKQATLLIDTLPPKTIAKRVRFIMNK